ncbi:MAG: glycosyltransferase family 4 protein, partial [Desulfosudaceae bacterium]
MKLALVRQQYTDFGGAERYTAALAEHLLAAGHEVHIFAHEWKGDAAASKRLIFHRVPMIGGLSVLEALSFAGNTKKLLRRESFDIIHSFERTIYQDIYRAGDGCHAEWLLRRRKIDPPYKRIINRINPLHRSLLWLEKRIFAPGNYRLIIANSERGKQEIMRHYGVPAENIRVVYNAVDLEKFQAGDGEEDRSAIRERLGMGASDPLLLYVGSGFKRKGVAAAMTALARLPENIRLVVVGRERLRPYRRLAAKLGLADRIYFT